MKNRIQFTPALTAALLCAGGWFTFWLFAFQPAPPRPVFTSVYPKVVRLAENNETMRKLKSPTLFALPSDEGFSGRFLESRVDLHLSLEKPASPVHYLPREKTAAPDMDRTLLTAETPLQQTVLTVPGAAPATEVQTDIPVTQEKK